MNEFGEPNMGNPSVRFDEGRERVGHWPLAFQSNRSCLLYRTEIFFSVFSVCSCEGSVSCFHKFAPGRINRLMPSVTFISWKLINNPSGTSSSFM